MLFQALITTVLFLSLADGQASQFRCRVAQGREPNVSDTSCASYYRCSNYTGQLQRCRSGQQFHYRDLACKADAEVWCNDQRRNYGRFLSQLNATATALNETVPEMPVSMNETEVENTTQVVNTTSAPPTNDTVAAGENNEQDDPVVDDGGIGALLSILFPQLANIPGIGNIFPGLVGLQAAVPDGIVGINANGAGLAPGFDDQAPAVVGPLEGPIGPPGVAPDSAFDTTGPIVINAVVTDPNVALVANENGRLPPAFNSQRGKQGDNTGTSNTINTRPFVIQDQSRNGLNGFAGVPVTSQNQANKVTNVVNTRPFVVQGQSPNGLNGFAGVRVTSKNQPRLVGTQSSIPLNGQPQSTLVTAQTSTPVINQGPQNAFVPRQNVGITGSGIVNPSSVGTVPQIAVTQPVQQQGHSVFGHSIPNRVMPEQTTFTGSQPTVTDQTSPAAFFPAEILRNVLLESRANTDPDISHGSSEILALSMPSEDNAGEKQLEILPVSPRFKRSVGRRHWASRVHRRFGKGRTRSSRKRTKLNKSLPLKRYFPGRSENMLYPGDTTTIAHGQTPRLHELIVNKQRPYVPTFQTALKMLVDNISRRFSKRARSLNSDGNPRRPHSQTAWNQPHRGTDTPFTSVLQPSNNPVFSLNAGHVFSTSFSTSSRTQMPGMYRQGTQSESIPLNYFSYLEPNAGHFYQDGKKPVVLYHQHIQNVKKSVDQRIDESPQIFPEEQDSPPHQHPVIKKQDNIVPHDQNADLAYHEHKESPSYPTDNGDSLPHLHYLHSSTTVQTSDNSQQQGQKNSLGCEKDENHRKTDFELEATQNRLSIKVSEVSNSLTITLRPNQEQTRGLSLEVGEGIHRSDWLLNLTLAGTNVGRPIPNVADSQKNETKTGGVNGYGHTVTHKGLSKSQSKPPVSSNQDTGTDSSSAASNSHLNTATTDTPAAPFNQSGQNGNDRNDSPNSINVNDNTEETLNEFINGHSQTNSVPTTTSIPLQTNSPNPYVFPYMPFGMDALSRPATSDIGGYQPFSPFAMMGANPNEDFLGHENVMSHGHAGQFPWGQINAFLGQGTVNSAKTDLLNVGGSFRPGFAGGFGSKRQETQFLQNGI